MTETMTHKTNCTAEIFPGDPCTCHAKTKTIRPASISQINFIRTLIDERTGDSGEIVTAAKAALAGGIISKTEASAIITSLKTVSIVSDGVSDIRKNSWDGTCGHCKTNVPAGTGRIQKTKYDGRWQTYHLSGECPTAEEIAAVEAVRVTEPGMYKVGDDIYKVRWNMGKSRLYALRLVHGTDGIVFDYDKSAMDVIRAEHALTAAEAHAFGASFNTCVNCLKDLTDDKSVVAKYGHTCAKNMGWRYPTMKEAHAVLAGDTTWAEILAAG